MVWFWIVVALAVALVAALVVAGALVARRRLRARKRPRLAPKPSLPVVLAHGLLGFDEIGRHHYFRGVSERLELAGATVHRARVPPSASVAVRAARLATLVRAIPAKKVNIVAHSMGGLDARYAIAHLGIADRVASLTTIGTPHLGTPLADLGTGVLDLLQLRRVLPIDALYDLTTTRMQTFNRRVRDVERVVYLSVVARMPSDGRHPLLWAAHRYLRERAGDNDGLVPVESQRWGEVLREIEADHWAQIGWSGAFDAPALFEEILRELRARGF
jgi:triacylglycerol lipase